MMEDFAIEKVALFTSLSGRRYQIHPGIGHIYHGLAYTALLQPRPELKKRGRRVVKSPGVHLSN